MGLYSSTFRAVPNRLCCVKRGVVFVVAAAGPSILWTVHLMPFYALIAVYSGPPRSHHDLGPTARLFVVAAYVVHVLSRHFPGL
jgi:hypothetical protein